MPGWCRWDLGLYPAYRRGDEFGAMLDVLLLRRGEILASFLLSLVMRGLCSSYPHRYPMAMLHIIHGMSSCCSSRSLSST